MDAPMLITLIVFLFMIVSFSRHRIPMALTSVIGLPWTPRPPSPTWAAARSSP